MGLESKTMNIHREGQLVWLTFPHFDATNKLKHCFSTRHGGVSKGIYSTMNLGFSRGDDENSVKKNYEILCNAIGVDANDLVLSHQVHKDHIRIVTADDLGKGYSKERDYKDVDGLVTNVKGIPLVTFYADCVPIFFLDPVKEVAGMAHAGWRGTVKEIGAKMLDTMVKIYDCNLSDILVGIGPSIGPCCFEVDQSVYDIFKSTFPDDEKKLAKARQNNKYMIDLWTANKLSLIKKGLPENNIIVTDLCTKCEKEDFHSHRGTQGRRGSLVGIVQL